GFRAVVNGHAVCLLLWPVTQFTILDAPINREDYALIKADAAANLWTLLGFKGGPTTDIFFRNLTNFVGRGWVDSYIARDREIGVFIFGDKIPGSAPGDGEYVSGVTH